MKDREITAKYILNKYGSDGEKIALGRAQADVLYLYKELYINFRRCLCYLYMMKEYNYGFNTMFESVKKHSIFIYYILGVLRKNKLEKEELLCLYRESTKSENRLVNVNRIIAENIKETEVYPFYRHLINNGIDVFDEVLSNREERIDDIVNQFKVGADKYNKEHPEEYKEHQVVMKRLIENREHAISARKEMAKIEKETKKAIEKQEKAEIKEMKHNKMKHIERDRALGIAGNAYHYSK